MKPKVGSGSGSSSSSSSSYDVFINFRGEDTRNTFVGHLYRALKDCGIHVFMDSKDLWKGEDIGSELLGAIRGSKLSIAILSERYAESKWCLLELVQMLECDRVYGQVIFPIFFKVKTSDVKNQSGSFEISLKKYAKETTETLLRWKDALRAVGDKSGWVFEDGETKWMEISPRNLKLNYDTKIFQKMPNLRLLRVDDATLEGNFQCLPPTLRWLGWCYCPLEKLPSNFYLEEIVMLDLSHGCFKLAWSDWLENKLFQRLKVLKLSYCQNMSESLDFSGFPQLEKLYLNNCHSLFNLHESLGQLQQLVYLNLAFCPSLKKLPDTICRLSSLQKLILSHCSSLRELPESIGDLKESLVELLLDYTGIEALPDSFGLLKKLDVLDLSQCFELLDLSRSFENMTSLRFIHLSGGRAKLRNIPNLPSTLVELRLCEFVEAYSSAVNSMYNLKRLELLCLKTLCGKEEQFIRGVVRTCYIEFRKVGFGMREFGVVNHICVHYRWLTHSQDQSSPFLLEEECLRANNEGLRQIWIGLQDQRDEGLFRKYVIPDDDDDEICRRRLVMHVSMRVSGFDPIFARQAKGALRVKTTLEFKARIYGHKDQKISYCESSRLRFEDVEFINRDIPGVPKFRRFDYLNIECVHRFKGFDWFGFQLEGGDTIEILEVDQYHDPADEYGRERGIRCTVTELNLFLMKEDEEHNLKMFFNNPSSTTVAPNKKRRLTDQGEYCSEDDYEVFHCLELKHCWTVLES